MSARRMLPLLIALVCASHARAAADGFVLVCNARAATTALPRSDVRALFTGKTKLLDGNVVIIVVRPADDPPFAQFVDQVFGIPAGTLLSKIKQEVFKGEMSKPLRAATDEEVIRQVISAPGALGVVSTQGARGLPATVTAIAIGGWR